MWAKQSTAKTIMIGPILDSSGVAVTSLTDASIIKIAKNGTVGALNGSATLTHDHTGNYKLALTASDTDTLGAIELSLNSGTNAMQSVKLTCVPATVYDALVTNATTAAGGLGDIQRMAGTVLTARDIGASVLLSSGTGTGQLKLASGYVAMTWADIAAQTTTVALTGTTIKTATDVEADTADIQARLPAALTANGNMKSSLMEILTTALTETAGLLAGGFKKFFNVATPTGTVNSLPDSVPGAAGGLFIAGSNAATTAATWTVTGATVHTGNVSMASGLTITQSAANSAGVSITGNGSGYGIASTGGATGGGAKFSGGATDGDGLLCVGKGASDGIHTQGGTTGDGIHAMGGGLSGSGLLCEAVGSLDHGLKLVGGGAGDGLHATNVNIEGAFTCVVNSIPWAGAWDAEVQSECSDAITAAALATAANLLIVSDGVGYMTAALLGTISDAGTAGETYVVTFGGSTYTLDYTGLDATGNRTGVTRTKI